MSETERRLKYDDRRVLIETERVLDPQFGSAVLCLSGAQVELLRNIVAYLNRASTFVTAYAGTYYLTPTASEWDSLQSIVADLEDSLMTSEMGIYGWDGAAWHKLPMLFGYSDRWQEYVSSAAIGEGNAAVDTATIPAGYIYVVQRISIRHSAAVAKRLELMLWTASDYVHLFEDLSATEDLWHCFQCESVLKYQDYIRVVCTVPGAGETVFLRVWGYKMKIGE